LLWKYSGELYSIKCKFQLGELKQHLDEEGLTNVEIVKGTDDDPKLPATALDGVLIVNAYTK